MTNTITVEQYQNLLNNHDWYYQYSDDSRSWHRGNNQREKLLKIANLNPEFKKMYEDALHLRFKPNT